MSKTDKTPTVINVSGPDLTTASTGTKPLPTRCRVKLVDGLRVPIVGGNSAFDAEFDWNTMTAKGHVDGHVVLVGIQQCVLTFHK